MNDGGRKVAVLTGATDGMGRVVAPLLGKAGYFVWCKSLDATVARRWSTKSPQPEARPASWPGFTSLKDAAESLAN